MTINHTEPENKEIFVSSDLALVAVISLYFPIAIINKDNPKKAVFVFNRSQNLNKLADKYWNKKLLVEPRAYFDQLKAIKARLYAND